MKFGIRLFLENCRENAILLRFDKNNGYFIRGPMYIYDNISFNSS
jgi:hypothetical protein